MAGNGAEQVGEAEAELRGVSIFNHVKQFGCLVGV